MYHLKESLAPSNQVTLNGSIDEHLPTLRQMREMARRIGIDPTLNVAIVSLDPADAIVSARKEHLVHPVYLVKLASKVHKVSLDQRASKETKDLKVTIELHHPCLGITFTHHYLSLAQVKWDPLVYRDPKDQWVLLGTLVTLVPTVFLVSLAFLDPKEIEELMDATALMDHLAHQDLKERPACLAYLAFLGIKEIKEKLLMDLKEREATKVT